MHVLAELSLPPNQIMARACTPAVPHPHACRAAEIAEERVRRQQRRQDEQQQQAGSGGDGHASSPAGGQPQETGMVEVRCVQTV